MLKRVALVGDARTADLQADGPLLLAAFERVGLEAEIVGWGEGPDWKGFSAVLVRNTWDYVFDRERFLAWAEDVAAVTRLANSVGVLRWNTDKHYLGDLEAAGIPSVPTLWIEPGQPVPTVEWHDVVVKPSVSAGARLSARYRRGDELDDHVHRIHATGTAAMVQPYVESIERVGESGTYVFGGEVSHAIRKGPVLRAGAEPSDDMSAASHQLVTAANVQPALAAFALRVLDAAPSVLYARVDTAPDANGEPVLLELEVTEPYLFLEHAPEGADRFARAVAAWL